MIISEKFFPLLLLITGLILIAQVLFPIAIYNFWEVIYLQTSRNLVSPSPKLQSAYFEVSIQNQGNFPSFVSSFARSAPAPYSQFSLSVPKLGIKQAKVTVDSNDLDKGLVLLPGTALPGERGNVFISGHSSILLTNNFSQLTRLKEGDQVKLAVGEMQLNYQVVGVKVVDPDDLSVISAPDPLGRYLSLMTCVPPGLNIKRLIVLAKLI